MGDRLGQQGSQVYYDQDMGQYYTQAPSLQDANNMYMRDYPSIYTNSGPHNVTADNLYSSMFGDMPNRGRTYLNGFGQSSPALQQQAPYEYADVSLESLFPMLQGALQGSQGGAMEGGAGLLGSQGATGQASSGAGRFM